MKFGNLLRVMRLGDLLRNIRFFLNFQEWHFVRKFIENNEDYLVKKTSI